MECITSSQNPYIKEIKCLKERKHRENKNKFFIEGIRFVEEALCEDGMIDEIFISDQLTGNKGGKEILDKVYERNYKPLVVSDKLFKEISDTRTPQGILATIKAKQYSMDDIITDDNFLIILESIQDPGNLGTIIRTADAVGATGIILSKGCVDLYNPKVLRSTMGSIFHIPFYQSTDLVETLRWLKQKAVKVFAAHLKGSSNCFEVDMRGNVAVVIGNEAKGISDEAAKNADVLVKIPMNGRAESLNASVAAGILMYEVSRQRLRMKK